MVCCLNPYCDGNDGNPVNPDGAKRCQYCKEPLIPLLRGRFKVLRVLGQGGFGRTYLAEDHDRLKQLCVVKQLLPQGGSKAVELFQREAKQLQDLGQDNPQIPSLEAYFSENNALFLVQQFIEGETLAQELERRGKFTEEEVRSLLLDWLPLLAAVHCQGVIHRDLKPDNLMRRRDNGRVIMIDFGLSKQLKGSVVAMPGTTAGTYGYAPYEQMESGEANPSSDLYSVGATCFHLLSGKHPGRLWLDNGYNWVQSWQSHVSQPLSPELARVIDKCLRKDYTRRYQSAQEALQALTPAATKPSPPPPQPSPPPPQPAPKPKPPYTPTVPSPPRPPKPSPSPGKNLGRRAFVGLGVAAFGAVVARAWWQQRSPAPVKVTLTDESQVGACKNLMTPIVSGDLVAGLPTETYGFRTVVNLDEGGNGGQEVSQEVTRWVEDLGNGVLLYLVRVPAGSFTMGSPDAEVDRETDEGPQHEVYVPECWMGQFAVTQAQYRAITGQSPSSFGGDQNPVENVDWDDAMAFCEALRQKTGRNYHLPPEAIWEYACRACSTTPFHFGATIRPDLVNYNGNYPYRNAREGLYREQTVPVGSLPPNLWGLHEMHGNVWEWCEDPATDDYGWKNENHPARNNALNILPYGNIDGRVLRGGSWSDNAGLCRSANRNRWQRGSSGNNGGFRVLLSSRTS